MDQIIELPLDIYPIIGSFCYIPTLINLSRVSKDILYTFDNSYYLKNSFRLGKVKDFKTLIKQRHDIYMSRPWFYEVRSEYKKKSLEEILAWKNRNNIINF